MNTLKVFDTDYPIIAKLSDGWFVVAHPNGPAISTDKFNFLGSLAHPCDDVPETVRTKAIEALMDLYSKNQKRLICFVDGEGLQNYDATENYLTTTHTVGIASEATAEDWHALMKQKQITNYTLLKKS